MPNAALRNAANSANAVATTPSSGIPAANPITPKTANTSPTNWANFNGGTGSRSLTGLSRGATSLAKSNPYGLLRGPRTALIGEDDSLHAQNYRRGNWLNIETANVTTSTVVVIHAANRGPRTSTWLIPDDITLLLSSIRF